MSYRMSDKFWTTSDGQSQYGLTQAEKDENASRVYTFFTKQGWTKEAICGMLGNMDVESRMNPRAESTGADTYGLVQWHPASKLTNWAISENLNWELGLTQCKRIAYEEYLNLQWASWSTYTFSYWAREMIDTVEHMAQIFMTHYEVADPGTLAERQEWALYYYDVVKLISDFPLFIIPIASAMKKKNLLKKPRCIL